MIVLVTRSLDLPGYIISLRDEERSSCVSPSAKTMRQFTRQPDSRLLKGNYEAIYIRNTNSK